MVDEKKAEEAIRMLLQAVGEDIEREGLKDTPKRVARMYTEILQGMDEEPDAQLQVTFAVENSDMVLEKDIPVYSLCEHHLMPFFGKVHVAYLPDQRVTGLSKIARTVEVYARRPQLQERLTNQIADAMERCLGAKGVMVVMEAEHTCMTMRGVKKPGTKTVTYALRGQFRTDLALQQRVLSLIR